MIGSHKMKKYKACNEDVLADKCSSKKDVTISNKLNLWKNVHKVEEVLAN